MTRGIRVLNAWDRDEIQITGDTVAPGLQQALLNYRADEDQTLFSVLCQVALSGEPNLTAGTAAQIAGFVRLKILRLGQSSNVVVPSAAWHSPQEADFAAPGPAYEDTLHDDRDVGETWAIVPYAISSTVGGSNGPAHLILAPKTKRKMRKGDLLILDLHYSNSGSSNFILAWSATGTLVVGD